MNNYGLSRLSEWELISLVKQACEDIKNAEPELVLGQAFPHNSHSYVRVSGLARLREALNHIDGYVEEKNRRLKELGVGGKQNE
jgi:hypothetical protein